MCGIIGFFSDSHSALKEGLFAIRRRGPDDLGEWSDRDKGLFLGHARLSILDVTTAGNQPMISSDGRVVMVFNGEIYNFHKLRNSLEKFGDKFHGHSDSEVLLALFCRYGIECLTMLNGIFAVAFWERDKQTLWLARDQLGVKPLYIYEEAGHFAFASEIKGLLRGGLCKAEIDPQGVLFHLGYLWSPGETTIVRGVKKVLPGQALCITKGGVQKRWFYYDLPIESNMSALSINEMAKDLANTVQIAVKRQLVSDVPVGAFLSGGLDSSSVVAFAAAQQISGKRLQCFSMEIANHSQNEGFSEDLPYAKKVAKHLDVDLHIVRVGDEMIDRLPEMVYLLDEPTADPAALNTLVIAELAKKNGIKVLLSGAGGDDIFTGYRRHYAIDKEALWSDFPQWLRSSIAYSANTLPVFSSWSRRLTKAFRYADLQVDERLISYLFWLKPQQALELLSPELRASLNYDNLFTPLRETLSRLPKDLSPLEKMIYLEGKHFLADHNLHYTDKMGMAAGIEVRVPLLDLDVVKLAYSIPMEYKQRAKEGKWIFKKAMEPFLPHDVIYRPKTGFGVPLRQWLKGRLKPMVDEILSPSSLQARGIFNPEKVAQLIKNDRSGRIDAVYPIFSIICMELWCRQYIDGFYALD